MKEKKYNLDNNENNLNYGLQTKRNEVVALIH